KKVERARPMFDEPAPDVVGDEPPPADAVLDPLAIYQKGEGMLRQQLGALSTSHLVNVIRAYGLSEEPAAVLKQLSSAALIARIVAGCERLSDRL
ncbi:MAG TPA: hypothetical protein VKB36_09540, partial [Vicinamibacterales bacterium]|nr:hypothetical protein [Vicinamibacterales bacterium]